MKKIKLLIVDDLSIVREGIKHKIKQEPTIELVAETSSCESAIQYLKYNPNTVNVLLMDIESSVDCGTHIINTIKQIDPMVNVLVFTLNHERKTVLSFIKAGALGYVLKNDDNELLKSIKEVAKKNKYFSNKISVSMVDYMMNKRGENEDVTLSKREIEILENIAKGQTNKETGMVLGISSRTVETHRRNIFEKIGVRNTAEMIKYSLMNNIISY